MSTEHAKGDYERLKAELRRLKRSGAPWYFESELHQRLHGAHPRRTRLRPFGPLPAFVISIAALCSIAVAVYVLMVNSDLFPVGGRGDRTQTSTASADSTPPAAGEGPMSVKSTPQLLARDEVLSQVKRDSARVPVATGRAPIPAMGKTVLLQEAAALDSIHGHDTLYKADRSAVPADTVSKSRKIDSTAAQRGAVSVKKDSLVNTPLENPNR